MSIAQNEMTNGLLCLVGVFIWLFLIAFVTSLVDFIHARVTWLLVAIPSRMCNWNQGDFQPDGIWWNCVFAQIGFRAVGWLLNIDDEPIIFLAVFATAILLVLGGTRAVKVGSWKRKLVSGLASLLAVPVIAIVTVMIIGLICCIVIT